MSGEHRYRSSPATDEYRVNFDRIFRKVPKPAYVWTGNCWVDRRVIEKEKEKPHERQA